MNPLWILAIAVGLFFTKDCQDFMKEADEDFKKKKKLEAIKAKRELKRLAKEVKWNGYMVLEGHYPADKKDKPPEYTFSAKKLDVEDIYLLKSYTENGITVYPVVNLKGSLNPIYIDKKDYELLKELRTLP
jgi:hypothetical protein